MEQGSANLNLRRIQGLQARNLFPPSFSPCTQDLAVYFCLSALVPHSSDSAAESLPKRYTEADLFEDESEDVGLPPWAVNEEAEAIRSSALDGASLVYSSELARGTLAPEWEVIDSALLPQHVLAHCMQLRVSLMVVALPRRGPPGLDAADWDWGRGRDDSAEQGLCRPQETEADERMLLLEELRPTGLQRWAKLPFRNWKVRRRGTSSEDARPYTGGEAKGRRDGGFEAPEVEILEEEVLCVDVDLRQLVSVKRPPWELQADLGPNSLVFQATDGWYVLPNCLLSTSLKLETTRSVGKNAVRRDVDGPGESEQNGEEQVEKVGAQVSLEQLQEALYATGAAAMRLRQARAKRDAAREAVQHRGEVREHSLQRVESAKLARQRLAELHLQVEQQNALLERARVCIEECKREVLDRAPELLGAATSLAGARKRLEAAVGLLSSSAGHQHVAHLQCLLATQRRLLVARLLTVYPALLPCAVTPFVLPRSSSIAASPSLSASHSRSDSLSSETPPLPRTSSSPSLSHPLSANTSARNSSTDSLVRVAAAMPPLRTRPGSPPPAAKLSSADVLEAFIAGSNPLNLDLSARTSSSSPPPPPRVGPLGPCLCLDHVAAEALLFASPRAPNTLHPASNPQAAAFASLQVLAKGRPTQVLTSKQAYERAAAALGGVVHLVSLLANLLGLALRYPFRFGASRSFVQDASSIKPGGNSASRGPSRGSGPGPPDVSEFPLFAEGSDETKFSYAVFLLNKDIEQLLSSLQLPAVGPRQTLPNLHRLLAAIVSGRTSVC